MGEEIDWELMNEERGGAATSKLIVWSNGMDENK